MKKLLLLVLIITCGATLHAQKTSAPYVILISFDGFRYDYVEKYNAPTFKSIYKKGAFAKEMVPSFPSKTFPNHYTIVTGLYPGHHGIVDNSFYDKASSITYTMDKDASNPYFYGGVPLWELARQQGMESASYFWPGSELTLEPRQPNYFFKFDINVAPSVQLEQTFNWLKLPEAERPHIITLYFSLVDTSGHDFGPESEETKNSVLAADAIVDKLLKGLEEIDLPINVIIVSDHGMKELPVERETFIFLNELIPVKNPNIKVVNNGTQTHFYVSDPARKDSLYNFLKSNEKNYKTYKKEDLPERWNYQNDRVGDLIITATPGFYIRENSSYLATAKIGSKMGQHGYDPMIVTDMHGIFFAIGPNIKKGTEVAAFQNVNVYPLVAKILGLKTPKIDGKFEVLEKVYKK